MKIILLFESSAFESSADFPKEETENLQSTSP